MEELQRDLPPSPHPITLEDVVGSTVDAVMEEEPRSRCCGPGGACSPGGRLVETEELYAPPEPEPEPEEIPEIDTIGPEPELADAAADCRAESQAAQAAPPGGGAGGAAAGDPHGDRGLRL